MAMDYSKFKHSSEIYPYFMGVVESVLETVQAGGYTPVDGIERLREEVKAADEALDKLPFFG